MILGGTIIGGREVRGVPKVGVGHAGPDHMGDGAGEGSWVLLVHDTARLRIDAKIGRL